MRDLAWFFMCAAFFMLIDTALLFLVNKQPEQWPWWFRIPGSGVYAVAQEWLERKEEQ